jgi:hypothetical protein
MKSVTIYQLTKEAIKKNITAFMDYEFLVKHSGGINFDNYYKVYTCLREDDYTADDAWNEFNQFHPGGFTGHSLSISDILIIDNKVLYVDNFGFKTLLEW